MKVVQDFRCRLQASGKTGWFIEMNCCTQWKANTVKKRIVLMKCIALVNLWNFCVAFHFVCRT